MHIIGYALIVVGLFAMAVGILGIYRFDNFYARLLSSADVDTIGLVTTLVGVACLNGFNIVTLKILFIVSVLMIVNPIVSSSLAASAFFSGYKLAEHQEEVSDD